MDIFVVILAILGFLVIVWLAIAVDKRTKPIEYTDEEEISALLGVVMPKNEQKEEK